MLEPSRRDILVEYSAETKGATRRPPRSTFVGGSDPDPRGPSSSGPCLKSHPCDLACPFVRTCSRIGCSVPAATTALVRYEAREIELRPLVDEPDPHLVDLCSDHGARLTPPRGWTIDGDGLRQAVSA